MIGYTTYKALLPEFVAFPSVSTDSGHKDDMTKTADWLKQTFEKEGFEVSVVEGYGNPIVVAKYTIPNADESTERALIYGHYDVQPASEHEGWHADPFTVTEKDGRLNARGVIDNKGQVLVHIATVFELIKARKLAYNVTFMIEGDEENGSEKLGAFIENHKDLLEANFALVSDGEITQGMPTIELGFRGGLNTTLTVRTSHTDLHSGLFGGAVPNAGLTLNKFVAKLHDDENRVTIPEFYDDVDPIDAEVSKANAALPFDENEYKERTGTKTLDTEPEYDFYTQTGLRPAVEVIGMELGYTGEGYRNAIPSWARVKLNFRLVASQDPEKIAEDFKVYARKNIPDYADVEIDMATPWKGIKLNIDNTYIGRAKHILETVYDTKVLFKYCGGGLPIVTSFHDQLGIPQVLVPLANEDCNMHAVNENFLISQLEKSLQFSETFFSK